MATYLDGIVAWHRARAAAEVTPVSERAALAAEATRLDPPRPFEAALATHGGIAVVAEVKRRSPSKGDLDPSLDPAAVAAAYELGGAACLSVLTDGTHFGGSPADLGAARSAVRLPVLRKDFTVSVGDVYDARVMGADAVLLIAAVLGDDELLACADAARRLEMAALFEVHDEAEADRVLSAGATLVGVNQRDLHSFEVDVARARRVGSYLPDTVVKVAESGIESPGDVEALEAAGYDAVLVGERLVRSPDRSAAVRELTSTTRSARTSCG